MPPVPPVVLPPPAPASRGTGWSLVPLLSVGFGAPASFLYAAVRRRSVALGGAAAGYGAAVTFEFAAFLAGGGLAALGLLVMALTWTVSAAHAIAARPRVYPQDSVPDRMNRQVVEMARHRRSLREAARTIVLDDPGLARELRIGRPDLLPRPFDDGGLVDVNHVPPEVLNRLPGLTYAMVDRIMQIRTESGGFVSAEEMAVHADLPPSIVSEIAEYALFLR